MKFQCEKMGFNKVMGILRSPISMKIGDFETPGGPSFGYFVNIYQSFLFNFRFDSTPRLANHFYELKQ